MRGEGGRCFFCKAGISLDLFVVLIVVSTSIAAYGVTPHIKSVSTVTGQDRPRPRFPALIVPRPPRWEKPTRPLGVMEPRPLV